MNAADFRPCYPTGEEFYCTERGYLNIDAAARAVPILNRARHRFSKPPYSHITEMVQGESVRVVPVEAA